MRARRFSAVLTLVVGGWLLAGTAATAIPVNREVLDNGLILLTSEQRQLPLVHLNLLIRAGTAFDPPGKEGLANITAKCLLLGTRKRAAPQLAEKLDFLGGAVETVAERDYSVISATFLKKDLESGLEILAEILTEPRFASTDIERKKKETLAATRRGEENPEYLAERQFTTAVFKDHPYGKPPEGNTGSLSRLKRQDLLDFMRKYYRSGNAILGVTGDLTSSEARALIEVYFRRLRGKAVRAPAFPPPAVPTQEVLIRDERPFKQTTLIVGFPGISREAADYYPLVVMNQILGGAGFGSRLMDNLRERRGLVYDVHSMVDALKYAGTFYVTLQTKNESVTEALAEVERELNRLRREGVREEEVRWAREYLTGSFPLRFDTGAKIARLLTLVEFYNLGTQYFEEYPRRIGGVSREAVNAVAAKYIVPEKGIKVRVGNFKPQPSD